MIQISIGILGMVGLLVASTLLAIGTSIAAKIGGDEVSGFLPVWSHHFLERAVSRVPAEHQERYYAEWKAELSLFADRKLTGLMFAWRLSRKARSVGAAWKEEALDFGPNSEAATASTAVLDSSAIAEIVKRAVDRTQPQNQLTFVEIIEEMRSIVESVAGDTTPAKLTDLYVRDISEKRREGRVRPLLPAMRPRRSFPITRPTRLRRLDEQGLTQPDASLGSEYDADWGFPRDGYDRVTTRRSLEREGKPLLQRFVMTAKEWGRGEIWL